MTTGRDFARGVNPNHPATTVKATSGNGHFNPSEPRDDHGRWTNGGGTTKGHSAKVKVSVDPAKLGYRMEEIGRGGRVISAKEGGTWPKGVSIKEHSAGQGRHGYNPKSVNEAIAANNRHGPKIGGKEAALIHRLMRGRG